ncbi:MAG: cytochrome d ubiquinol oxidase subunit II [Candidatus Aminicenantes bacterium]|nr:cytochrome d ubiquinol oxidase subunit II [Candidatus Aminicenantes bacterium]
MDTYNILQQVWFVLVGVLLVGYSILDGFDLGIGALFPFLAKRDEDKEVLVKAIGPFWDGNEVWLLTGGGALFAAFPQAYATVFSGFYLALMVILFALIFRAISLEFRAHDPKRKRFWEGAFVVGSFLPALLFGVALGNVVQGVPLNADMDFTGNFFTLLRPFPLVIGLLGLTAFLLHGAVFATLKSMGSLQARARKTAGSLWFVFLGLFALSSILSLVYLPGTAGNWLAWAFSAQVLIYLFLLRNALRGKKDGHAFFFSAAAFACLWAIVGAVHFPNLVKASNDAALSLTITNASSSELTLKVMLIIALIGMPIVIFYTIYAYRVFRGKAVAEEEVY